MRLRSRGCNPLKRGICLTNKSQLHVLDTSVLIHDPEALNNYPGGHVAIPLFVVMELDDLKTSPRHEVSTPARMASREIVELQKYGSLHDPKGVVDPDTGTTVYVVGGDTKSIRESISSRKMDLLILGSALELQERFEDFKVTLVSKDVNLRILADSQGLGTDDYNQDRVLESDVPKGWVEVETSDFDYEQEGLVTVNGKVIAPNEFIRCGETIVRYRKNKITPCSTLFRGTGITPRNPEQRMAMDLLMDPNVSLVTLLGISGTGKTICALGAALAQLDRTYDKIILSKPVVAMGKDLGYLPGDQGEKLAPWMLSFQDNLDQLISTDNDHQGRKGSRERTWEQLFHSKKMEMQPLHSIRGRSISRAFIIVDEVQNISPHEVKTVVSRAALGTKVVLCGDPDQIDDSYLDRYTNGLVHAATVSYGSPIAGTVTLTEGVRSPLAELAATRF